MQCTLNWQSYHSGLSSMTLNILTWILLQCTYAVMFVTLILKQAPDPMHTLNHQLPTNIFPLLPCKCGQTRHLPNCPNYFHDSLYLVCGVTEDRYGLPRLTLSTDLRIRRLSCIRQPHLLQLHQQHNSVWRYVYKEDSQFAQNLKLNVQVHVIWYTLLIHNSQWSFSNLDRQLGIEESVLISEVSWFQGV